MIMFQPAVRATLCRPLVAFTVVIAITGCTTVDRAMEWWKGEERAAPRIAPGVTEYQCDGNKFFQVRYQEEGRLAWVRFPDREFRLDAIPGAVAGRYSNGRTTLNTKGEEAFLTEGSTVTYANCKRTTQG